MAAKSQEKVDDFEYQLQAQQDFCDGHQQQQQQAGYTRVDPSDGTVYEWDSEKRAWFPKIDKDFIAAYQESYGFFSATTEDGSDSKLSETTSPDKDSQVKTKPEASQGEAGKKKGQSSTVAEWFDIDENHNSRIYISGLPSDITMEEFKELVSKCGIVMEDDDGEPKLKLYRDINGQLKGDGLCCYLKKESVLIALQILDDSDFRGHRVKVEQARFEMKGQYNPELKKKKKKKGKKKKGNPQEKLLGWWERKSDQKVQKEDRIVVFKNLFNPKEFEADPTLITDIRDDLKQECEKFGPTKKFMIFDRHPEGMGSVAFKEHISAEACITQLNGRWYGGRQLEAFKWDGITNYQMEETEKERELRLKEWNEFISLDAPSSQQSAESTKLESEAT